MRSRYQQLIAGVGTAILMGGCATNLTETEQYESQSAYDERRDQIHAFVNNCEGMGNVVTYTGPTTHRLRDPVKWVPRHARPSDYQCASTQEIERYQVEMGIR